MMLNLLRDLRGLVSAANDIAAAAPGDAPRWSLFLTNRSFIAIAVAVALNVADLLGVPLAEWLGPIAPDATADQVVQAATALLAAWAVVERVIGKTRVVWSKRQAAQAVQEAIAVSEAPQAAVQANVLSQALVGPDKAEGAS